METGNDTVRLLSFERLGSMSTRGCWFEGGTGSWLAFVAWTWGTSKYMNFLIFTWHHFWKRLSGIWPSDQMPTLNWEDGKVRDTCQDSLLQVKVRGYFLGGWLDQPVRLSIRASTSKPSSTWISTIPKPRFERTCANRWPSFSQEVTNNPQHVGNFPPLCFSLLGSGYGRCTPLSSGRKATGLK